MIFPGAKLLPGWHRVFLGKTPPFPGTLKQFLGISIAPPRTSSVLVRAWFLAKPDFESSTGPTWTDLTWTDPAAALGNVNLSDLESYIVMLGFACVRRKGSSHAFFLSFLSLCKDNLDGMKRLDRIVPGAICV
jgi:hypothetical protein